MDKKLTELVPVEKTYDDIVHPAATQIGLGAEGIMKFIVLPFKFLGMTADQLEKKFFNFIENAIKKVPENKRIIPRAANIVPILDKAKYSFDVPELESLFSELLARSLHSDFQSIIHPSFADKISSMTPLDASLMKSIAHYGYSEETEFSYGHKDIESKYNNDVYCSTIKLHYNRTGPNEQLYSMVDYFLICNINSYYDDYVTTMRIKGSIDYLVSCGFITIIDTERMDSKHFLHEAAIFFDDSNPNYENPHKIEMLPNCMERIIVELQNHDWISAKYPPKFDYPYIGSELSEKSLSIIKHLMNDVNGAVSNIETTRGKIRLTDYGRSFCLSVGIFPIS